MKVLVTRTYKSDCSTETIKAELKGNDWYGLDGMPLDDELQTAIPNILAGAVYEHDNFTVTVSIEE